MPRARSMDLLRHVKASNLVRTGAIAWPVRVCLQEVRSPDSGAKRLFPTKRLPVEIGSYTRT